MHFSVMDRMMFGWDICPLADQGVKCERETEMLYLCWFYKIYDKMNKLEWWYVLNEYGAENFLLKEKLACTMEANVQVWLDT